jgi:transposase
MTLDQAIVRIDSIAKENGVLAKENAALAARVRLLEEHIRLSRLKQFGPSSEKSDGGQRVLDVFDEAEVSADPAVPEPTVESITYTRRKQKGHRRQLFDDLPVERIDIELPEGERNCSECQGPLDDIGVEISQKLKIVPAQYSVEETARHKYVCPHCQNEGTTRIVAAPAPELAFPKSMATPSVVAHVMNQKFVSGVPLYRQEQELARIDLSISRQTMANWMIAGAVWLEAIYDQMKRHLLSGDIVHADETTLQVLCEPGREAQTTSYMWLYRSGAYRPPGGPGPIVLYEYQRTRAREHPLKFLQGYKGYLHTDGYEAYNTLPDVIGVGCWALGARSALLPRGAGGAAKGPARGCVQTGQYRARRDRT